MRKSRSIAAAILIAAVVAVGFLSPGSALALNPGDSVVFLLPADGLQPDPPVNIHADKIIYTGG